MNPMVIMMGVSLLLMVVFPKMMANMDPEQLKEMKEMQAPTPSPTPSQPQAQPPPYSPLLHRAGSPT